MKKNSQIYSTRREAIRYEIFPFTIGWEHDFDIDHLEDNLLTQHYDDDGRFLGVSVEQVSDEDFAAILREAMELAGW